jgi:cation-transporting P-type ATPase 13A2
VTTIAVGLAISVYMTTTPSRWVRKLMQLTHMSSSFKTTILALGLAYLIVAWVSENYVFQRLARLAGRAKLAATGRAKIRKEYKLIAERMMI